MYSLEIVIKDHPADVTKFADEDALFFCIASDVGSFQWKVNGSATNMLPSKVKEDILFTSDILENSTLVISTLTINASAAYNGTGVQCVVTGGHGSVESNTATLTIQGMTAHNVIAIFIERVFISTEML